MGILKAENSISYTANNACKIYIIKQVSYEDKSKFIEDYNSILGDATDINKFFNGNNAAHSGEKGIKLVPLLDYDKCNSLYTEFPITKTIDSPKFELSDGKVPEKFYFLKSLLELRNCPLLDLSRLAYVFQMDGQAIGGLANVVSFNANFSVNGQSSAELVLNNKDFKYNFKYFNDKQKYPFHLKSYFDTNDIIIIRYQKKNLAESNLLSSFKRTQLDYWKDPYIGSENDPFTTVFTGYINDVNNSFSFTNGIQTVTLSCTGPSKKLTWNRLLSNRAAASKDALSAILPISAYTNPQTFNNKNKSSIRNDELVSNLIVRTYSGVLNIPEIKQAFETFTEKFDENNNIKTSNEIKDLENKIKDLDVKKDIKQIDDYNKQLEQKKSDIKEQIQKARNDYNELINKYMDQFVDGNDEVGWIAIKGNRFAYSSVFGEPPYVFKIEGTDQPAYQWTFNNWSSLFKSDFSTVYQFIKSIADYLQFNFYDDPYGTIHFSIPDMDLSHLHNSNHPNNLNQLINFTETQNTENIANIQYCEAKYKYDLSFDMINTVAKDYKSISKYGEKMMQPFSMIGLTEPAAIRYAAKMRMAKYNRKALSNIRITMQGEPCLEMDKYAYIKSLRKLFYIESYSHSYTAGGEFTTSLNGTYTRDILALMDIKQQEGTKLDTKLTNITNSLSTEGQIGNMSDKLNLNNNLSEYVFNSYKEAQLQQKLENASTMSDILKVLETIKFPNHDILVQKIYQIYVDNWDYPEKDENLKFDIGAMYTAKNLRQCYLDGFFWALPFDVNPYAMAQQIQIDEQNKVRQFEKTKNEKAVSQKPDIIVDNKVVNNTTNLTTMVSKDKTTVSNVSNFNLDKVKKSSTNIPESKSLTVTISNSKYAPIFNRQGLDL